MKIRDILDVLSIVLILVIGIVASIYLSPDMQLRNVVPWTLFTFTAIDIAVFIFGAIIEFFGAIIKIGIFLWQNRQELIDEWKKTYNKK